MAWQLVRGLSIQGERFGGQLAARGGLLVEGGGVPGGGRDKGRKKPLFLTSEERAVPMFD